jgi:hypothetical protein
MDELDFSEPILPYAGTSGWSGSDTSKERAITNDKNGTTSKRQLYARNLVWASEYEGLTWKELSEITGWHHGTASGVLSVLDKAGKIFRLKKTRNRCAIYVTKSNIGMREIAIRKTKSCKHCGGEL